MPPPRAANLPSGVHQLTPSALRNVTRRNVRCKNRCCSSHTGPGVQFHRRHRAPLLWSRRSSRASNISSLSRSLCCAVYHGSSVATLPPRDTQARGGSTLQARGRSRQAAALSRVCFARASSPCKAQTALKLRRRDAATVSRCAGLVLRLARRTPSSGRSRSTRQHPGVWEASATGMRHPCAWQRHHSPRSTTLQGGNRERTPHVQNTEPEAARTMSTRHRSCVPGEGGTGMRHPGARQQHRALTRSREPAAACRCRRRARQTFHPACIN